MERFACAVQKHNNLITICTKKRIVRLSGGVRTGRFCDSFFTGVLQFNKNFFEHAELLCKVTKFLQNPLNDLNFKKNMLQ